MMVDAADDTLQIAPPVVDIRDAEAMAQRLFGLVASAARLTGERDLNFLLTREDGAKFVFKIANAGEQADILDFQLSALSHLATSDVAAFVPNVVAAGSGERLLRIEDSLGRPHFACLLSYIDGTPMAGSPPGRDPAAFASIGALLGRLDLALAPFSHKAQRRRLPWDLSLAAELRPKLAALDDAAPRALALDALDRFEDEVLPRLDTLPRQVIHNDLNPHNLILAGSDPFAIAGIIDFGDMLDAPRANDVAVAASYHFQHGLDAAAELIAGYHAVVGLTEAERRLVPLLIAARAILTVGITSWRARRYPENRAYIVRNLPAAVETLSRLSGDGRRRLQDKIDAACEQEDR